jgi:hypothetical protein
MGIPPRGKLRTQPAIEKFPLVSKERTSTRRKALNGKLQTEASYM